MWESEIFPVFHLTFLQLNVIKCSLCSKNCFFTYFLRTPDNSNLFSISLEGSSYRESTVFLSLGTLRYHNGDDKENVKKAIGWSKNSARASRFFDIQVLPSLHDYDRKMPNFTFYGEPKQATANLRASSPIWASEESLTFSRDSLRLPK